ncbi:MAG: glutathione-disulfide reductase [Rhodospirillaceae bacterium]|nr:glutathione-disulfide reductase [Rhodospirillaceae bacterium]
MASYDFDLFVIGGGSGGVRSARISATHGARVGLAEDRYMGGTCVNVGCVPKKLMVYAAHFAHDVEDAAGFGWTVDGARHDWATLIANKDTEIARLNGIYRRLLDGAGVTIFDARARLADAHTIEMGETRVTAERILVATGGWPVIPEDHPGHQHGITSNEVFHLPRLPERVLIVGGGYIAVEFAGILHGLGSKVTQIYRGPLFLRGFDNDLRSCLAMEMVKGGIDLRFDCNVARVDRSGDTLLAELTDEDVLEVDCVLYAVGRRPNTRNLGLEDAGVAMDKHGAVLVNADFQSSVPHIYALGDVTDRINLTPVATAEGHALADTLFGGRPRRVGYENIPTAVFSTPPCGTVGLTEAEARARFGAVDVYKSDFKAMKHTLSGRDERTMMKLVVDRNTDRVLGAHMVGPDAGEIMQGVAVALNCGATKADFDRTIGIHPTAAEELVTMRTPMPDPDVDEEGLAAD